MQWEVGSDQRGRHVKNAKKEKELFIVILLYTFQRNVKIQQNCLFKLSSDLQSAIEYFFSLKNVLISSEKQDNMLNFLYFQWL